MVAFNVDGVEPLKPTKKGAKSVLMPDCVAKYYEGMLGGDLADWKTQKYRVGIKGKNSDDHSVIHRESNRNE